MADNLIRKSTLVKIADILRDKTKYRDALIKYISGRKIGKEIEIPEGVTIIKDYAFNNYFINISSIPDSVTYIGDYAFNNCTFTITSLPSNLEIIGTMALGEFKTPTLVIPASVRKIGFNAFGITEDLTSITFEGTPESITSSSFEYCKNLTTINVPWAEGTIAGAPWGAINATINYNYTEEV